jgi:hypothetical protein
MNMPSLRELQSSFAAAVFSGNEAAGEFLSCCTGSQAARGLQAYRNSVLANLAGAVRTTYPVLQRIVGQAFLDAAIRHYVLERPSTSGDLNAYGGDFDAFIAAYEPAAELPYLPDVARLEWQVQCLYGMADAPAQDLALLATTQPEHWGDLHFRLDPAHAVLASRWPLARIWEVNQPGHDGNFQVDFDIPQTVLVHRRPAGTVVEHLDEGVCALIQALAADATLAEAVDQAARHEAFELQPALQRFVTNGLICQAC